MSTFLELCVDLRRESGISGTGPTGVTGQSGEMLRVVEWVALAYEKVQNLHPNWDFLRTEFSFNTIATTANYTKAAVGLPELGSWKIDSLRYYLTSTGIASQQDCVYVPWDEFRETYTRGNLSMQPGEPLVVTVKPDQSLAFWSIPDDDYTITGEYYKRAQKMAVNTDEPLIPRAFQDVLVWRGLMYYGAFAGASEKYAHGKNEYGEALAKLELNQLPAMLLGETLT